MPKSPTTRERPAKPALSREWIVAETIAIMRAEGLQRATMRRVAQALDTGAASLYVYVANTAELHAAVLDTLIGALWPGADAEPAPEPKPSDWRAGLTTLLADYAAILFAEPGLARSALVLQPTGPHAVRLYDRVLGLLLEGGIEPRRASWGVDLLLQYITATAAEHTAPTADDVDAPADEEAGWDALTRALRTADARLTPHVAAHAADLLSGSATQRVDWALSVLLAGIASTPTPEES